MAKKRKTQAASLSQVQQFIQFLKANSDQNHALNGLMISVQNYITQLDPLPNIAEQAADITLSLKVLDQQPLSKLQLTRLIQQDAKADLTLFEQLKIVIETHIQITADTRKLLDPYCKSEQDYSSRIAHYKKWLLNTLCIYLGYVAHDLQVDQLTLIAFLSFINRIYEGTTTSRVTLRQTAHIQAHALVELPRNTMVQIFGKIINQHWVKVIYTAEQGTIEGYVQLVYLKIAHELAV